MRPAFHYTITDRALALLRGGFREDEVVANLEVEFTLDEFQIEDLTKLVKLVNDKRKTADALRTA